MNKTKEKIKFKEITQDTLFDILQLSSTLSERHRKMVATNSVSIAEAHFHNHAWFRGIYAGDTPVGFIMLETSGIMIDENFNKTGKPFNGWFLWRFMIAGTEHGKGYGRQALDLVVKMMREKNLTELYCSCGQGDGSPLGFYEKYGFIKTGRMLEDEVELLLKIK